MLYILLYVSLIIGGLSFALYKYLTWHFDHWIKRKIPGPKPKAFYGTFPGTVSGTQNFIYDLNDVYKQFKNNTHFVGVFDTRNPQLLILDPEMCKDILISNFKRFQDNQSSKWMDRIKEPVSGNNPFVLPAADWKIKRGEIVSGLTSSKIKSMLPIIEIICGKLIKYLKKELKNGNNTIDAKEVSLYYTDEVVADVVWGIEAGIFEEGSHAKFLNMSKQLIAQTFKAFKYFFILGLFPIIKYFVYVRFHPEVADRFFLKLTQMGLQRRLSQPNTARHDFLQHLVELHQNKGIDETQILANALTFHFDGFETTATLISHCLLLLARRSDAQKKLRSEIQEFKEIHGNSLDFDDLTKLPYLEQCIAETLRIFTPLPFMSKICTQACKLKNNDGLYHQVEPGDVCLISLHSLHHDEEYFPQPEEFLPERFAEENGGTKKFKDMGVYLPFGDGPRICIGMKFGLTQTKAAIVNVVEHFELTVNERTRKDNYQSANGFITGLDGGIFLNLKDLKMEEE